MKVEQALRYTNRDKAKMVVSGLIGLLAVLVLLIVLYLLLALRFVSW